MQASLFLPHLCTCMPLVICPVSAHIKEPGEVLKEEQSAGVVYLRAPSIQCLSPLPTLRMLSEC